MSRSAQWQRVPSDTVSWHQDQALNATIYILREVGPTSFLLKEDGETRKFKVSLGDPHICGCSTFKKENVPCKHICWLLLKKFKLDRQNELSYQLGLVEREINEVLRNPVRRRPSSQQRLPAKQNGDTASEAGERKELQQRTLTSDDVCPICQDQLLAKRQPVTYCRYGCGNSVHIKCMKVWVDHQRQSTGSSTILCPFCREDFGSQSMLSREFRNTVQETRPSADMLAHHIGTNCGGCGASPIKGKCYQCMACTSFHLCNSCYHGRRHMQHSFVFRVKKAQRWRSAPSRDSLQNQGMETLLGPLVSELQSRDITEADYDVLLGLDGSNQMPVDLAGLPESLINRIPMLKVKHGCRLLAPGRQCRLCLRAYIVGEFVRRLPGCGHSFHRGCIDDWLRGDHRRCPIDRELVFDPSSTHSESSRTMEVPDGSHRPDDDEGELVVPGVGLIRTAPRNNDVIGEATTAASISVRPKQRPVVISCKMSSSPYTLCDVTMKDLLVQADAVGVAKSKTRGSARTGRDPDGASEQREAGSRRRVSERASGLRKRPPRNCGGGRGGEGRPRCQGVFPAEEIFLNDHCLAISGTHFRKSSPPCKALPTRRIDATLLSEVRGMSPPSVEGQDSQHVSASVPSTQGVDHQADPCHTGGPHCDGEGQIVSLDLMNLSCTNLGDRPSDCDDVVTKSVAAHNKLHPMQTENPRKVPKRRERNPAMVPDVSPWELTQDGRVIWNLPDVIEGLSGVHLSRNVTQEREVSPQESNSRWCSSAPVLVRRREHS